MSTDQPAANTSGRPRTAAGDKCPSLAALPEKRPWGPWAAIFTIAVLLVAAFTSAEWDFTALTDPDQRRLALGRMGAWLAAFAAPDFSAEFLRHSWFYRRRSFPGSGVDGLDFCEADNVDSVEGMFYYLVIMV